MKHLLSIMTKIKDLSIIFLVVFFFASILFGIHMFGEDFNILIAVILYAGLYLVLAYHNAISLGGEIKIEKESRESEE